MDTIAFIAGLTGLVLIQISLIKTYYEGED